MIVRTLLLSLFVFASVQLSAQYHPQYSLFDFNAHQFNPAYAGMDDYLSVTGAVRKQWVGLSGSPLTQNVNVHLPWLYTGGAVGLNIDNDLIGAERNTSVTLTYAQHINLSDDATLSVGVGAGLLQKSLDGTKLRTPEGNYEGSTFDHNDMSLPLGVSSAFAPLVNGGIWLRFDRLDIGVSGFNLLDSELKYSFQQDVSIRLGRTFFATAGYKFDVADRLALKPIVFAKTDLVETQLEAGLRATILDDFLVSLSMRGYNDVSLDAVIVGLGVRVGEHWTLGYGYDATLSALRTVSSGSHEVVIKYNLGRDIGGPIPSKIIYNPRYPERSF